MVSGQPEPVLGYPLTMPTHMDIPTTAGMETLVGWRGPGSVSIYLPTEPDGHNSQGERIDLSNLASDAVEQLQAAGVNRSVVSAIDESLEDLVDDAMFWRFQAWTLAVFVNEHGLVSYRLPNRLPRSVEVSDRFYIKPLLRTFTFPHAAFILAISQNDVRLLAASPDLPPDRVPVPGLPSDAASVAGKPLIPSSGNRPRLMPRGRGHRARVGASDDQKLRMRQYARQVNQSLAPLLGGHDIPLVLAGTAPMIPIYRSVNSYPHLVDEVIPGNPDSTSDADLIAELRPILDRLYADDLANLIDLFGARQAHGRAVTDLADVARAATIGAVDTLLVDIEQSIPGEIDEETGRITTDTTPGGNTYGVTDEITRRVLMSKGRILAVRGDEMPGDGPVAALLRFGLS